MFSARCKIWGRSKKCRKSICGWGERASFSHKTELQRSFLENWRHKAIHSGYALHDLEPRIWNLPWVLAIRMGWLKLWGTTGWVCFEHSPHGEVCCNWIDFWNDARFLLSRQTQRIEQRYPQQTPIESHECPNQLILRHHSDWKVIPDVLRWHSCFWWQTTSRLQQNLEWWIQTC